jgi:hypothetical protein
VVDCFTGRCSSTFSRLFLKKQVIGEMTDVDETGIFRNRYANTVACSLPGTKMQIS